MTKVLLVTGGSRGIGAAICKQAAHEGYIVAVNYTRDEAAAQNVVETIADAGGTASAVQADVADENQVLRMVSTVEDRHGPVWGLVNSAGITGPLGPFLDADPDVVDKVFRTNVLGTMHCCRAILRSYAKNGTKGVIVNVSSIAAATGSPNEYVHYAASKSAIETFTFGLAKEWAAQGIRLCCVAPGSTLTDIHATAGEPLRPQRLAPAIPMKRLAEPKEISEAVLWLLSPAASYVTGATLRCSGGL